MFRCDEFERSVGHSCEDDIRYLNTWIWRKDEANYKFWRQLCNIYIKLMTINRCIYGENGEQQEILESATTSNSGLGYRSSVQPLFKN